MGALAQLSVRPVPGNGPDSFIYVKNEILYVTNDIKLDSNFTVGQNASIYLREGGQLIQGSDALNAGNGFLSVQQTTHPTNAFAYYFWASPVGNPAPDGATLAAGNQNFGLNSIYEPVDDPNGIFAKKSNNIGGRDGFNDPILTISRRWMHYSDTPRTQAQGYTRFNASNSVRPGFGFTMKGVNDGPAGTLQPPLGLGHSQIYEFRGRPNNGDFIIPVQGPEIVGSTDVTNIRMTLSGNPYPSALDLNRVFWEGGLDNPLTAFYYYDADRSATDHLFRNKPYGFGVYVPGVSDPDGTADGGLYVNATFSIWNAAGETNGNSHGTGAYTANRRFAPIGQGIMFAGKDDERTVTIKNSHRRFIKEGGTENSVFHRSTAGTPELASSLNPNIDPAISIPTTPVPIDNRPAHTRLYVVFDNGLTRDMVLAFSREASDGYDRGLDGPHPGGMNSDAFFPIEINNERRPFVISGTNFSPEKRIPISFKMHREGRVKIVIADEFRKPYESIYLYDHQKDIYMELKEESGLREEERSGVAFDLPTGVYDDRFFIVFQKEDLTSLPWPKAALDSFKANVGVFQNNPVQRLEVQNPEGYNLKSISVFDMSGKLVISEKNLGDNTSHSFYTGQLSDGVYLVKLVTTDDMQVDYKAIIMNR